MILDVNRPAFRTIDKQKLRTSVIQLFYRFFERIWTDKEVIKLLLERISLIPLAYRRKCGWQHSHGHAHYNWPTTNPSRRSSAMPCYNYHFLKSWNWYRSYCNCGRIFLLGKVCGNPLAFPLALTTNEY